MKVLASHIGSTDARGDRSDIAMLCRMLHLTDADRVMEIVLRYYPESRVSPRAVFLVREILSSPSL